MKPFGELTRLGRIRRMRQLATAALMNYGVDEAHIDLVRQAGNTLFRVKTSNLPRSEAPDGLFEEGQYLLRVHEPGYQEPEANHGPQGPPYSLPLPGGERAGVRGPVLFTQSPAAST